MGPTRKSTSTRCFLDEKETSQSKDGNDSKRSNSRKRKFSDMLGSRWTTGELTLFYNSYRRYGRDWEKVSKTLQNRSSEMVEALFMTNKVYLSLPHECASAAGLCAMMTDRYNNMVERSDNGAESSQKAKKPAHGDVHPTTSKASSAKVVSKSPTITSKYGCLELLRKKRSGGIWPHPVGKRTPRFPVEYPEENNGYVSPTTRGLKMKADELAREAAIILRELPHKDGSPEASQTPSKRPESAFSLLQRKNSMEERVEDGILGATVNEDVLDGSSGLNICDLSGYKRNTVESVGKGIVTQNGRIPDEGALQMLADLSEMMPTENDDVIRSEGATMKDVLSDSELQSNEMSKPAKDPVFGISSIPEENEDRHVPTIKTKRKKHKLSISKVYNTETHPDNGSPWIEVGNAKKKTVTDKTNSPKLMKNENSFSDNATKEGIDSAKSSVPVPVAGRVVSLPNTLRSRCKAKLRKPQCFRFSHIMSNDQINQLAGSPNDQAFSLKEMMSNCLSNQHFRRWCTFEWFYSPIDYPWFSKRELVDFMRHLGLGRARLTRVEWGVIKSCLGELRRFSPQFLKEERESLNQYRESVRKHYSELRGGVKEGSSFDIAKPLSVGQHVIAIHPKTREIHDGSVLRVERSKYQIQFRGHNLGVEFVEDTDCMPSSENCMKLFPNTNKTDGISQLSSTANQQTKTKCGPEDIKAHQLPVYSEPETVDKIKAKETDAQAISELKRALNKKEAIVLELRHMNDDDELENMHGDSTLKNSVLYEKQRAALLTQLNEANKQVVSALCFLRERNTYNGKLQVTTDHDNTFCAQNDTTSILHESESHVNEIVDSSRTKARIMVDAAVQAPDSKLSKSSNTEPQIPSELINKCVAALIMIQRCTEQQFPPSDVAQIIEHAVMSLQPRSEQNLSVYSDIQMCMGIIKNQLIALVPKERLS